MSKRNDNPGGLGGLRSMAQAMERLACSRSKIVRLVREGRLETVKLDRRRKITERSLQRLETELLNQETRDVARGA
jgi:excisionase family DNA binding protein